MRHGPSNRRQRNNRPTQNRQHGGQSRMQVFDSNGPDVRIRGTAHQVAEKYMTLAKDAASMGDRVLAEGYLQHAEHYQRIINRSESDVRADNHSDNSVSANNTYDPRYDQKNAEPQEDDLSLPASILGQSSNVPSEAAFAPRTPSVAVQAEVTE